MKNMKEKLKEIWRMPMKMSMRRRLRTKKVRIVSSMCAGGILYHDLGLQFLSPTINMTIEPFGLFCENLERYLSVPIDAWQSHTHPTGGYPVLEYFDVTLKGVHYYTTEEMKEAWSRRVKRFWNEDAPIVVIASDAQIKTDEDIERFHRLPYKKVCFTNKKIPYDEFIYIPGYDDQPYVGDILRYTDVWGTRVFEKYLDCVKWIDG